MSKYNVKTENPRGQSLRIDTQIAGEINMLAGAIYSLIYHFVKDNELKEDERVFFEGEYWMFHSVRALQEGYYPYCTTKQVRWSIDRLIEEGYLKTKKDPSVRNNTSLYTVTGK